MCSLRSEEASDPTGQEHTAFAFLPYQNPEGPTYTTIMEVYMDPLGNMKITQNLLTLEPDNTAHLCGPHGTAIAHSSHAALTLLRSCTVPLQ